MKIDVNIRYRLIQNTADFETFKKDFRTLFVGNYLAPEIWSREKGSISYTITTNSSENDVTIHSIIENAKTFVAKYVAKLDILIQIPEIKRVKEVVQKHKDFGSGMYFADIDSIISSDQSVVFAKIMDGLFDVNDSFVADKRKLILIGKKKSYEGFETAVETMGNLLRNQGLKFRSVGMMKGEFTSIDSVHQW